MENANSHDYLHKIKSTVIENIRRTGKPSVEAFTNIPDGLNRMDSDAEDEEDDLDADENPDKRVTQRQRDKQIVHDNEFDEPSDDEEYKDSLGVRRQPGQKRRRGIMDFQNPNALPDDIEGDGTRALNGESGRTTTQPSPAPGRRSVSRASSARPAANGTASTRTRTPAVPADEDGDVEMENASPGEEETKSAEQGANLAAPGPSEATSQTAPAASSRSASPAGVVTPPESPLPPADMGDVEMEDENENENEERAEEIQKEKDEGLKERVEEEERGEAEAEAKTDK